MPAHVMHPGVRRMRRLLRQMVRGSDFGSGVFVRDRHGRGALRGRVIAALRTERDRREHE